MKASNLDYIVNGITCRAYCVDSASSTEKRPGLLMYPDFWGVNDRQKKVAEKWAKKLGVVVLVADMYGNQEIGKSFEDSGRLMSEVTKDSNTYQDRKMAAYDLLKHHPGIDQNQLFCIGYCWGGAIALSLARQTDDLAGVISVHGILSTKERAHADKKMPRMLILNGARDKMVADEDIQFFRDEMIACHADFTFVSFGQATHAFTNTEAAGNDVVAYHQGADQWSDFLIEKFVSIGKTV